MIDELVRKVVRPGIKVEFLPKAGRQSDEKPKSYLSKVCDIREDGMIEIYMPMEGTKLIPIQIGEEYRMLFYGLNSMYQGDVRAVERYKSGNMFIVLVELTGELKKKQRRDYYRFQCSIDMRDRPLTDEEKILIESGQNVMDISRIPFGQSRIVDISGGGICFISAHRYEADNWIFCRFTLDKQYVVCARILSSEPVENRIGEYMHRAEYVRMREAEREEIIHYIFVRQREIRQNKGGD